MRFARATGDVHALSAADVRLLALTHSLEVGANGGGHLRQLPPQPKDARKRVSDAKALPGWGAEGGDWAEMDRLNEEELAAAEAALLAGGGSRIAAGVQALSLGGEPGPGEEDGGAGGAAEGGERRHGGDAGEAEGEGEGASGSSEGEDGSSEGEGWDQGWQTAARTPNVARRQRRRAARRAEREAEAAAETAARGAEEGEDGSDGGGGGSGSSSGSDSEDDGQGHAAESDDAGPSSGFESTVSVITADFAMQNVALQVGTGHVVAGGSAA